MSSTHRFGAWSAIPSTQANRIRASQAMCGACRPRGRGPPLYISPQSSFCHVLKTFRPNFPRWLVEPFLFYIYTLTRHSRPPGTLPVLSSPFPLSFLACPFTSFHFTAASAPFISLKTPSFAFLSLFDLSFSCSLVSLQRPLHFRAMPLTCISFTFQSLLFPFSPLVRIASMHSIIRIIRDDAGNAGGVVQY